MDIPSWCRVGQKVVCVNGEPMDGAAYDVLPETGGVYTIRRVQANFLFGTPARIREHAIWLDEIIRLPKVDFPFGLCRFKPLTDTPSKAEQDIELFLKIANSAPSERELDAAKEREQALKKEELAEYEMAQALARAAAHGRGGA